MAKATLKQIRSKKILIPLIALIFLGAGLFYYFSSVQAFTSNNGIVMYGDGTTATTRGRTNARSYTYGNPGTVSAERVAAQHASDSNNIQYIVEKAAPTRTEKLVGQQKSDGRLDVETCISDCSNAGSFVAQWSSTVIASSTVARAFDISYEQLSGRGMVVYGDSSQTGKLYYCIWDGTSWAPVSNCAPDTTTHTNEISLNDGVNSALTGNIRWVRMSAYGQQYGDNRSNQILMAVQDSNNDIYVIRWNGSSWVTSDDQVVTTTGGASAIQATFDVNWENISGTEIIMYAEGTNIHYRTSTGSGWGSTTPGSGSVAQSSTGAVEWLKIASDSKSNRLSAIAGLTTSLTVRVYIWKTDGTTAGWTAGSTDLTAETTSGINQNLATAWEKSNSGTPKALFVSSASNALVSSYRTWTQAGGFTSWATTTGSNTDDADNVILSASPNSDDIMMVRSDIDCDMKMQGYTGSAWKTLVATTVTTTLSSNIGTTSCSSNTNHGQQPFDYAHIPYSAWSLNWRVFDDEATNGDPQRPLNSQDTQTTVKPNNTVRLRMNIAELSGGSGSGSRKKLQYSSGAGCPDSTACTWTDVGAQGSGSIWRYGNGGLTDDNLVPSTLLTGSTAQGRVVENGTAASVDTPAGSSVSEYDFTLQNNGATIGTIYYFRAYDYGASISGGTAVNLNPILRKQILDTSGTEQTSCNNGAIAVVCAYPTLLAYTSAPHPPTFYKPTNGNTNVSTTPTIQLKSSEEENDYIDYVIEYCPTNSWPCASGGGVFCQLDVVIAPTCTGSQTGWSAQDDNGGLAYAGDFLEANSTMAIYLVSPGIFRPSTTYYLRAKAIDPGGSGTYSLYSSTVSFTTASLEILIRGGTCIGGVGSSCAAGSGSFTVKLGN